MKSKAQFKSRLTTFVFIVSVLFGIFLIVAPLIVGRINQSRSDATITSYQSSVSEKADYYKKEFERADKYNKSLASSNKDDDITSEYNSILDVENGIMGYIEIPRISIRDPIYHGIDESVLQHGIGHIPNTSFPVGGIGTHAGLSGHRGLPSSRLFTDLDQMRVNDIILIKIADHKLAYKVYKVETVSPDYKDGLKIDPEKDLLTLVTCTPYAINTHRLLVHAERTEYQEEMASIKAEHTLSESDRILLLALAIVMTILLVDTIIIIRRKNRV